MTKAPATPAGGEGPDAIDRLLAGRLHDPHSVLGAHPVAGGVAVRASHPDATSCAVILTDGAHEMKRIRGAVFEYVVTGASLPIRYRLRFQFANGSAWERDDPY